MGSVGEGFGVFLGLLEDGEEFLPEFAVVIGEAG
jgi:hypothetical protein